jgi:hypothetical protein
MIGERRWSEESQPRLVFPPSGTNSLAHEIDRQIGIVQSRLADLGPEFDLSSDRPAFRLGVKLGVIIKNIAYADWHAHDSCSLLITTLVA